MRLTVKADMTGAFGANIKPMPELDRRTLRRLPQTGRRRRADQPGQSALDQLTRENAAAPEEISATSGELTAQAAQWERGISYFRIGAGGARGGGRAANDSKRR